MELALLGSLQEETHVKWEANLSAIVSGRQKMRYIKMRHKNAADRFEANTLLCSFNTIQPSNLVMDVYWLLGQNFCFDVQPDNDFSCFANNCRSMFDIKLNWVEKGLLYQDSGCILSVLCLFVFTSLHSSGL